MQKQTALAFIAIVFSTVFYVGELFFLPTSLQSCWIVLVDAICMWLMFGCASPVWIFLSKYICCNILYQEAQQINNTSKIDDISYGLSTMDTSAYLTQVVAK
eukprot:UN06394